MSEEKEVKQAARMEEIRALSRAADHAYHVLDAPTLTDAASDALAGPGD